MRGSFCVSPGGPKGHQSFKGKSLSTAISKLVMRLVRHCDQERETDATVHWDTIKPKLLDIKEHEIFRTDMSFKTCMKEVTRRGVQFKDTLVGT